jgi:allophanate hydrolase
MGGEPVPVDRGPSEAAALLYSTAFVAERLQATADLLARQALLPVLRSIWKMPPGTTRAASGARATAVRRRPEILDGIDVLLVPTAPALYTLDAVLADPLRLSDARALRELRQPAGPRGHRRPGQIPAGWQPFGVSLVGPWGRDAVLAGLGIGCTA